MDFKLPLSSYRARHNISFDYQTQHLQKEHCRFLSKETCRADDQAHVQRKRQARDHQRQRRQSRQLRRSQLRQRRQLNPSTMNDDDSGDEENTKSFRVLVLLVKFTDHDANPDWLQHLPSRDYFDELFNGANSSNNRQDDKDDDNMSIAEYLRFNSMNRYRVEFDVMDWQTTDNSEMFFADNVAGRVGMDQLQQVFTPILDEMDAQGFDWSPYDQAGADIGSNSGGSDGFLDHLVVIHSGIGAEHGDPPGPCDNPDTADIVFPQVMDRIWSQGAGAVSDPWTGSSGIQLGGFAISGAFEKPLCDMVRPYVASRRRVAFCSIECVALDG